MPDSVLLHGTCVAVGSHGVLLTGEPGCGKSDLALRLIDIPGQGVGAEPVVSRLVADDQVLVRRDGRSLLASAPERLRGLLEVRGLGIVSVAVQEQVQLQLILELGAEDEVERMPDLALCRKDILGVAVPCLKLDPFAPSAAAWVRVAAVTMADTLSN